jgi:hypothetical protein
MGEREEGLGWSLVVKTWLAARIEKPWGLIETKYVALPIRSTAFGNRDIVVIHGTAR